MNSYTDIISVSSQALLSSSFWGLTYFFVIFSPFFAYGRRFISQEITPLFETVAIALLLQVGTMTAFTVIGIFIENINIGNNHLNPTSAFAIFFGNGSELIDIRWGSYVTSISNDSSALTSFGNEAKGVAFLFNKYIGIIYRYLIMLLFLFSFYYIFAEYMRTGTYEYQIFQRLYSLFFKIITLMLLVGIHSTIGVTYVSYFGIEDSIATNMISTFQKIISEIFYT